MKLLLVLTLVATFSCGNTPHSKQRQIHLTLEQYNLWQGYIRYPQGTLKQMESARLNQAKKNVRQFCQKKKVQFETIVKDPQDSQYQRLYFSCSL